jgi:hypothetical protein
VFHRARERRPRDGGPVRQRRRLRARQCARAIRNRTARSDGVARAGFRAERLASPIPESFALAIRSAATDPEPEQLAAAPRTARDYDWPKVCARYFALVESIDRRIRRQGRPLRLPAPAAYQKPRTFHQAKPTVSQIVTFATDAAKPTFHQSRSDT